MKITKCLNYPGVVGHWKKKVESVVHAQRVFHSAGWVGLHTILTLRQLSEFHLSSWGENIPRCFR